MSNPSYKPNDSEKSGEYDTYKLSYVNNFIIQTLNQASGGCFRNIGFDKIKFNNGNWDTIIHLYEQKKYFGVMLRAVVQESQDGKLSMVYVGLLSPMPVDTKFSTNNIPLSDENTVPAAVEFVPLLTEGHYQGVHTVRGVERNEEWDPVKLSDTEPYHNFINQDQST